MRGFFIGYKLVRFVDAYQPQTRPEARPGIDQDDLPALRLRDTAKRDSACRHRERDLSEVQCHLHGSKESFLAPQRRGIPVTIAFASGMAEG